MQGLFVNKQGRDKWPAFLSPAQLAGIPKKGEANDVRESEF
jgi:hypothetical protein